MTSKIVTQGQRPPGQSAFTKHPDDMNIPSLPESAERRLLRELCVDYNIRKTSTLVAVYNYVKSADERTVLYKWLRLYGEKTDESLHPEAVLDYAEISRIIPRTPEDIELLRTLLANISSRFIPDQFVEKNTGKALYETLLSVPAAVFEDTTLLLSLVEKLLSSLARRSIFNRSSFKDHKSTFFSLRFILGYLETVSHPRLSRVKKQEFRQLVVEKRRELVSSFKCYPVRFHFKIIEKSIERLTVTDDSSFLGRSIRYGTLEMCGMHRMIQMLMPSMSSVDLHDLTPKNAVEEMKKVGTTAGIQEEHWIYLIQKLTETGMKALQTAEEMENFMDWYNAVIEIQQDLKEGEEQKALRYGTIYELQQLSTWAHSNEVRKRAAKMLTDLCMTRGTIEAWTEDLNLFEAFFKAIYRVHVRGVLREETEAALRHLNDKHIPEAEKMLENWSRFSSFEEKLKIRRDGRVRSYWSKELSITLGEMIGYLPLQDVYRCMKDVIKAYNQYDFTKALSLINNGSCKHVKDMEFCILAYDNPDNEKLVQWSIEAGSGYDPVNAQFTWAHNTRERINPEELFRRKGHESRLRTANIRKVLVHGNPGSGKTCLSRMLGHKWAQGGFMEEFRTVYVLPVRKLCSVDEGGRGSLTLEEAIADICYSECRDRVTQTLRAVIHDNLSSQRTLLVLDGIDKADELASGIITNAKERQCKILLLTCSYSPCGELLFADRVVECLGLDDQQVETFAESELSTRALGEFMKYFKSNSELWNLVHVPVMTYILCLFWADNEETLVQEKRRKSVFSLYTKIVNMLWSRFSRKPRMDRVLREDVLRRVDVIAFRAVQKNQRLIDRSIFEEQASTAVVEGMLRDSGYLFFDMENNKYHFPNLTFQEYFAGRYIAYRLRKGTLRERQESADFLAKRKYYRKNQMIIALTAQALADWRGTAVVREVFSSIDRLPVEILGVQHFFLKLQILDQWAAGLVDSLVDDDWIGGTASQVIDALVHILTHLEPSTRLWNLIMEKLDQHRDLLAGFSTVVLDTLTETNRTEELIGTHMFEDVVKLAKHAPRHLNTLVGMARNKLSNRSPRIRKQALDMIQDLMRHIPKLFGELFLMLDTRYTDLDEDVRQRIILVVGNVAKKVPRYATKLMSILKRGCVDANQGARIVAMLSSEAFLSGSPKLLNEFLPLLERGVSDSEEGVRMIATLMIGRLLIANPSFLSDFMPLIERACGHTHEDVREKAMEVIGQMMETEPSCTVSLMPMLKRGMEDASEDVSQAALDAIEAVEAAAYQPPGCSASTSTAVWPDTHRGIDRTEDNVDHCASIAGPSSSSDFYRGVNCNGDTDAKTEDDDTIRDTFQKLILKVTTNRNPESTRHLLELLFEFPVTIEETMHSDQVNIRLHAKTSESLGTYQRETAHLLVSNVERSFQEEYPGILEFIRSA